MFFLIWLGFASLLKFFFLSRETLITRMSLSICHENFDENAVTLQCEHDGPDFFTTLGSRYGTLGVLYLYCVIAESTW